MASLIHCPHCGPRSVDEFTCKGDANVVMPNIDTPVDDTAWHDYVFVRDNPRGPHREYWHHLGGCRRWLAVERDTLTHQVFRVTDASTAK